MRSLHLILAAAVLSPAVGCNWMKDRKDGGGSYRPRPTEKLPDVAPNRLVKYLNDRATQFQSIDYGDVRYHCSQGVVPLPALEGNLACAQPRNFRMVGTRTPGTRVDVGSNDQQFWMFVQIPTQKPTYVYASHDDFKAGKARLPDDVPFEPEWVMQAIGMMTLPAGDQYRVEINERDRTYTLWWPATTPAGLQIRKEIVFDGDSAAPPHPQVKRHVVRDPRTKRVICTAEIKSAQAIPAGTDAETGYPLAIQYPTRVVLRWEEQKFEMDMTLDKARVNQPVPEEQARRLFTRPTIQNVPEINLANYRETGLRKG